MIDLVEEAIENNVVLKHLNDKIDVGGGGVNVGVTKKYVDEQDDAIKAELKVDIDANTDNITINATDIEALDTRVTALEAGTGGGTSDVTKAYVDTQDNAIKVDVQANTDNITTNTSNINLILQAPLTEDANVLGTEEILTRKPDGTMTTINQSVLAGSGGGTTSSGYKVKLIDASTVINSQTIKNADEYLIGASSQAINIICQSLTKEDFEAAFGVDSFRKVVKFTLEETVIKSVPVLEGSASIATHSLVNATSGVNRNGVTISGDTTNELTTRVFASCFAREYYEWERDRGETGLVSSEFKNIVQLVFAGEYFEVEWRDWDDDGIFKPWVRPPLWYKAPYINSGGLLRKGSYINDRCKGIATTTFSQSYTLVTDEFTINGIDLGDILAIDHCLKYRLGMLIPKQIAPNCLASGGTRNDFRQDSLLLEAPSSLSAVAKISTTMYASELCPLMYDNASNSYMPIHMSNRTIKGYSEIKTMYSDNLRNIAEHNALLKHEHISTFPSQAYCASTEAQAILQTGGVHMEHTNVYKNFIDFNKDSTAVVGGVSPQIRVNGLENRVDSIYQQMYLFF